MKKFLPLLATCMLLAMNVYSNRQVVNVSGTSFTPANFTISLGDTVEWRLGSFNHTTTSTTIPAGAATWDFDGNVFIYVPAVTGVYNYKCIPHASMGMVAKFTVTSDCPAASAQISAGGPTTFCKNNSVLLSSSVSANITSFQWRRNGTNITGATNPTYIAKTTGTYTLRVVNNCGNSAISNGISVTVNPLPPATITPSGTVNICSGDSLALQANTGTGLTYQWTRNAVNIAGATKSSYTAKTAGNYRVVVTRTSTGCKKTSAATKVTVIACADGIAKLPDDKIKVFPNPSSGDFHISLPVVTEKISLLIFDNTGNLVETKDLVSKEISFGGSLKPGIYLVQLRNTNKILFEEKIVKE